MLGFSTEPTIDHLPLDMFPFRDTRQQEEFAQSLIKDRIAKPHGKEYAEMYDQPLQAILPKFDHSYFEAERAKRVAKKLEKGDLEDGEVEDTDEEEFKLPRIKLTRSDSIPIVQTMGRKDSPAPLTRKRGPIQKLSPEKRGISDAKGMSDDIEI